MTKTLQEKSVRLVAAFEKRLGNDKSELLTSSTDAAHGGRSVDFEVVRYIAHRIVGSARLFGCHELTIPARNVERLVEYGADASLIIEAVNELADLIDEALTGGLPAPEWIDSQLH